MLENQSTTLVGSGLYITHNAGSIFSPDSNSWTFEWIAPSQGTGEITFYASMNAANGDGTTFGDIIYHSTMTILEDTLTPVTRIDETSF